MESIIRQGAVSGPVTVQLYQYALEQSVHIASQYSWCQIFRDFQRRCCPILLRVQAVKVSNPLFAEDSAKFVRYIKGYFPKRHVRVRILPGQPASPAFIEYYFFSAEMPANGGLFMRKESLWRPMFAPIPPEIRESLHVSIGKFPFSGDWSQRPENKTTVR